MKTGKPFLPAIFGLMACLLSFAPALALESLVIAYPTTSSQFTPLWFARDVGFTRNTTWTASWSSSRAAACCSKR